MPVIIAETSAQVRDYARRLLDAADDPAQVQTDTSVGGVIGFRVPDAVAAAAGFEVTDDGTDEEVNVVIGTGGGGGGIGTVPDASTVVYSDPGGQDSTGAGNGDNPVPVDPPARNASRDEWAEFLDAQGIEFEAGARRDELVAAWDAHQADQGQQ